MFRLKRKTLHQQVVAMGLCLLFTVNETVVGQESVAVFEPVPDQYSSTRIPALVVTEKGTLLAFAAGRIENASDWADMDLLLRRSDDSGETWGPIQVVAERAGGKPTDNPTPIVGKDGTIHLVYQRDYAYAYRSEEHTTELQSLMRISYAVFCLKT